jgi:hypothetical protein
VRYEVIGETEEINEAPTDREVIMGNSTHGDSALGDNVKYEPQEHQTSLSDVPQITTQVQANPNQDDEEDAKMTGHPTHMSLEAEPTTQLPAEQWPTEVPEVSNIKENRSLEGHKKTKQATSDDKNKGMTLTKEKLEVGIIDEEA